MADRHQPNSWNGYLAVHASKIDVYLGHFILDDRLAVTVTADLVAWTGELICADGIEIHVSKRQSSWLRSGQRWVRTESYSYQVLQRLEGRERNVFRYDNSPHHDHQDPHHRHDYDVNGVEFGRPEWVGAHGWPTLGDVLDEAYRWWLSRHVGGG